MEKTRSHRFQLFAFFMAVCCFSSCIKDVPYPSLPGTQNDWVINAVMNPSQRIQVRVGKTQPMSVLNPVLNISNATVFIADSAGNTIEPLVFQPDLQSYISTFVPKAGWSYTLFVVDTVSNVSVTAQDVLPEFPPRVTVDTSTLFFLGRDQFFQLSLIISDYPERPDFYSFFIQKEVRTFIRDVNGLVIDSVDVTEWPELITNDFWFIQNNNPQYSRKQLFLPDQEFSGRVAFIKFGIDNPFVSSPNTTLLSLKLVSISHSRNHYLYLNSLNQHLLFQNNPLTRPTPVFTNISGGHGIFGSCYPDTLTLYQR
jgi:hypothetical protein